MKKTVTAWAVFGLAPSPIPMWTTADGKFFGSINGLGILPVGYEGDLVALEKAQDDALAARQLGVAPKDCIVVEDSIPGVEAAVAARMPVVGFCGGGHCPEGHAYRLMAAGCSHVFAEMPDLAIFLSEVCCG